jgi:hypothetical protein
MSITPLKLTPKQWFIEIRPKMIEVYGVSINISYVQKRKLGFVARRAHGPKEHYEECYYIDFWEEKYKTAFLLRWV